MRLPGRHPLLDDAAGTANLDDLRVIAQAAYEAWRAQRPGPDDGGPDDGGGYNDRYLHLGTALDNAGRITGDLTP